MASDPTTVDMTKDMIKEEDINFSYKIVNLLKLF